MRPSDLSGFDLFCWAFGQTAIVYGATFALVFGTRAVVEALWRRHKARRALTDERSST